MGLLTTNCWWTKTRPPTLGLSGKFIGACNVPKILHAKLSHGYGVRVFANRNSVKKFRRDRETYQNVTPMTNKSPSNEYDGLADRSPLQDDYVQDNKKVPSFDNSAMQSSVTIPSRSNVLQACTITSGLIAALGVIIRQVSHVASTEGLPVLDCTTEVSFGFETWHLGLIAELVLLISSCRYLLLKTWPDFSESSEAANQQVLSSLQPLDYIVVAFLPGVSEELLFRGALLPLFGSNWESALVVAAIFGVLHLGNGRKYSFAVWATFVGFAYGYATIGSSSIIVPMASHAVSNLVGGILWRYKLK